jgi:hypothetical protein
MIDVALDMIETCTLCSNIIEAHHLSLVHEISVFLLFFCSLLGSF